MAVGDEHVFRGFLTPVLTQLFFPKPPTTFLTCFCRGERQKYAGKKVCLNCGSNLQPPGYESDKLTNEPPGRGTSKKGFDPLPEDKILDWSKLEQIADSLLEAFKMENKYHIG